MKSRSEHFKKMLLKQNFIVGQCIPSERQLAEKYGVSRATIGRVVSELVSEGLLERKWGKGVFYLGSRPKHVFVLFQVGSMMRSANPNSWFVPLDILKGILSAAGNRTAVDLCESADEILKLANPPLQGVIKIGEEEEQLEKLPENLPCVLVNCHEPSALPSVRCKVDEGISAGVSHLIRRGCSRIAYVGGPFSSTSQRLRLEGYKKALLDNNIQFIQGMISECSYGSDEGEQAMARLLKGNIRPEAVMCADDMRAMGVYQALKKAGLRVPQDVKLLGFDDIPDAENFEVPLSTLRYPRFEMGERAVEMLTGIINGRTDMSLREELDMKLLLRSSC
ncbi:MAG TPA: hypothetical protein DCZ94_17525 [Lentisphaeria bacterium]|nr:MAG: hypothetical protein A2X48_13285 [Lentisphaerae bacterium GWF2_49_21]HBC88745.1 hypothetical protein [Lentisphaeria bacterium]